MSTLKHTNGASSALGLIAVVLIISSLSSCQSYLNKFKPVYLTSEITLKDGTILQGTTANITNSSFKFKDKKTSKITTIANNNVASIVKHFPDYMVDYQQVEVKTKKKNKPLKTILAAYEVKGPVSLIHYQVYNKSVGAANSGGKMNYSSSDYITDFYYLQKPNEPGVLVEINTKIGVSAKEAFTAFAENFFGDMPALMDKIGDDGYEVKDIKKIVKEYNELKGK